MRAKLMLWGAAAALALTSTIAAANVVIVKSLGPSAKAYPRAKTLRGPGNFDTKQVTLASAASTRGRFGALRASEVARNPGIWEVDATQSGKVCVSDAKSLLLWRPESESQI